MAAKIVTKAIINECSTQEIASLLHDPNSFDSLVSAIAAKRNLNFDTFLIFCTAKTLILEFVSNNILTAQEAFNILVLFSPHQHITIV
jgi:hypothetical protein